MRNGQFAESRSPLAETAARISALADYLDSRVGIPDEAGWYRATELRDPELLAEWHGEVAERIGDPRVAAAYMSNWLIAYLVGGSVMPVLADRRLPLASHGEIALHRKSAGWFDALATGDEALAALPDDPAAGHPTVTVMTEAELFDALAARLLELEAVIAALRQACPIGLPALWGALADAIGSSSLQIAGLMERNRATAWRDAERIIKLVAARQPRMKARPRLFPVEYGGETELFHVRGTCCLYYRTVENPDRDGEGYCSSCPLRTDAGRRRALIDWLDQQQAAVAS